MNVRTVVEGTYRDLVVKTYLNDVLVSSVNLRSDDMIIESEPVTKSLCCKDCKFWGIGLGSCYKVNTIWNMDSNVTGFDNVVRYSDDQGLDVYLNTDPGFYCCKWEAKQMNVKIFYKNDIPSGVSKIIADGVECDWEELMEELYSDPVFDLFRIYVTPMGNAGGVEFALDYLIVTGKQNDLS